jgi:hypothetical protein
MLPHGPHEPRAQVAMLAAGPQVCPAGTQRLLKVPSGRQQAPPAQLLPAQQG